MVDHSCERFLLTCVSLSRMLNCPSESMWYQAPGWLGDRVDAQDEYYHTNAEEEGRGRNYQAVTPHLLLLATLSTPPGEDHEKGKHAQSIAGHAVDSPCGKRHDQKGECDQAIEGGQAAKDGHKQSGAEQDGAYVETIKVPVIWAGYIGVMQHMQHELDRIRKVMVPTIFLGQKVRLIRS